MASGGSFRFEPLGEEHLPLRAAFSCGVEALDRYLRERARKEKDQGIAAVHILRDTAANRIAGYYTLSALTVEHRDLPAELTRRLPRCPALPALLIGRLAADRRYQGRGLGAMLLMDALRRAHDLRQQVGALAVVVDAKDEAAVRFYRHFDFQPLADHDRRLFVPMRTIGRLFR